MKNGILLSGGSGTRLQPYTLHYSKHMIPVNGKFIIDYSLNTLKEIGCENITVVLGGNHFSQVVDHLKDGSDHGVNINFVYQKAPLGIAHAINLCRRYVQEEDRFAVVLGDNIFENPIKLNGVCGAQIVLDEDKCNQEDLKRFGVASFTKMGEFLRIDEKPQTFIPNTFNYPITGCYQFDQMYFELFHNLNPSARGEFEIVDIIQQYISLGELDFSWYRNALWSDAGTHASLNYVNNYFYNKGKK